MRTLSLVILFNCSLNSFSQKIKIGADYGRAYFIYNHKDFGNGLVKAHKSNYNFIAGVSLQKEFKKGLFWETGLRFTMYEQYYSTRKYWGAFEEAFPIIHIPALIGIEKKSKLGLYAAGGLIIGLMPDQYTAEYESIHIYPFVDSITRGVVYRRFTPVFPLLNINAGLQYKIAPSWGAELKASFGKGFIKITEYDIYYNDGSGSNDQRARQWGTGDFYTLSLGVRYSLKHNNSGKSKNLQ
jgi:hypothetical protein